MCFLFRHILLELATHRGHVMASSCHLCGHLGYVRLASHPSFICTSLGLSCAFSTVEVCRDLRPANVHWQTPTWPYRIISLFGRLGFLDSRFRSWDHEVFCASFTSSFLLHTAKFPLFQLSDRSCPRCAVPDCNSALRIARARLPMATQGLFRCSYEDTITQKQHQAVTCVWCAAFPPHSTFCLQVFELCHVNTELLCAVPMSGQGDP